jgi:hypothetical protein
MAAKKAEKGRARRPAAKKGASRANPKRSAARRTKSPSPVAKARKTARSQAKKAPTKAPRKTSPKKAAKRAPKRAVAIAIGDEVKSPAPARSAQVPAWSRTGASQRDYVSGIVCSIRDIRTGKTVKVAKGDMDRYVFEILGDETFARGLSSVANTETSAARARVQEVLRRLSRRKQMPTLAEAASQEEGFAGLDGWRVIKVHSAEIAPTPAGPEPPRPTKRRPPRA